MGTRAIIHFVNEAYKELRSEKYENKDVKGEVKVFTAMDGDPSNVLYNLVKTIRNLQRHEYKGKKWRWAMADNVASWYVYSVLDRYVKEVSEKFNDGWGQAWAFVVYHNLEILEYEMIDYEYWVYLDLEENGKEVKGKWKVVIEDKIHYRDYNLEIVFDDKDIVIKTNSRDENLVKVLDLLFKEFNIRYKLT